VPGFEPTKVGPDLNMLSVNSFHRANWRVNQLPRSSDEGGPYDALFKEKHADGSVTYASYNPSQHGIWKLASIEDSNILRPRLVQTARRVLVGGFNSGLDSRMPRALGTLETPSSHCAASARWRRLYATRRQHKNVGRG
jgi:hypothetical protein